MNDIDGVVVGVSGPLTALWAFRAWLPIAIICGIAVAFEDIGDGFLIAIVLAAVFGGLDSLWTWIKLSGNTVRITASSVTFHERFRRDRELPLSGGRMLLVESGGGFLHWFSPAYAQFAEVRLTGTCETMTVLVFTTKQAFALEDELRSVLASTRLG